MASRALKKRLGTRNKRRFVPVLMVLTVLVAICAAGGYAAWSICDSWLQDLPDYQDASSYNLAQKTRVYASDGTTLLAEFYLEDREPVSSLDDISDYVTEGTVATEDERYYEHGGVDVYGIARAVVVNFTGGSREGASTITQQFVRNTVLSDEAGESTIKRKVREAYISVKLEETYSKDEILLMYLNTINYGSGAYGIQAASLKYFSKDAKDLTLAESATLVAIPNSPTNYNPIDNPDNCLERRNLVLDRMLSNGYITQEEHDAAQAEPLGLNVQQSQTSDGIYAYPYFTSYVRDWLLDNYSEAEVFKGGLAVTTTLDVNAQNAAETACRNKEATMDSDIEVAMVATDPNTGYIKALVGGKDYYTDEYNLATQATRQPGSSFKTFTLAAAIEDGIDPNNTTVNCSSTATIDNWTVENYDQTNYGTRSIASAFAVSSNTGFARLCSVIGPQKVVDEAHKLGIESDLNAVPSITLGSQGVTVREMCQAYGTIATGGVQHDAIAVEKIVDSNGKSIYQADTTGTRVITEEVAKACENVMEGVLTYGSGTEARLTNGQTAAGKTGTSESFRDSWFCGITPSWSVAIWMGAREERTMSSYYTAPSVFKEFVTNMMGTNPTIESFPMSNAVNPTYRTLTNAELTTLGGYSTSGSSSSSGYNNYSSSNGYNSYDYNYGYNSSGTDSTYSNSGTSSGSSTSSTGSTSTGTTGTGTTGTGTGTGTGTTGTGTTGTGTTGTGTTGTGTTGTGTG